jgi:hypothetical protein
MSQAERIQPPRQAARTSGATALGAGVESALIGIAVTLVALVLAYALKLSDALQQCLPVSMILFGGLGALAGMWAYQRGALQLSWVVIAGAIAGVLSGMSAGALRGVFSAFLDLSTENFFVIGASEAGVLRFGLLQAFILTMPLTGILGLVCGALGALVAQQILLRTEEGAHAKPEADVPRTPRPPGAAASLPPLNEVPPPLHPAWSDLKAGNRAEAKTIVARYLKSHLDSEPAWLLMASALENPNQKRECLERALKLNPGGQLARDMLAQMEAPLTPVPAAAPGGARVEQESAAVRTAPSASGEEIKKRSILILTMALALAAFVPIVVMLVDRYALGMETLRPSVIFLAGACGFATGFNLLRGDDTPPSRIALSGAINGLVLALFATFAFSAAYHTIFLPMRADHNRLQGIFYLILRWGTGISFWGLAVGALSAVAAFYLNPARSWLRDRINAAAPHNVWVSLWLAYTTKDPALQRRIVDRALSMSPSNPLALRMKRSLETPAPSPGAEAVETAQKPTRRRFQLPPLVTSALGRKFLRRVVAFLIMFTACSLFGQLMGIEGDYFEVLTSFVVILLILFGGGFLLWLLMQVLRR